MGLGCFSKSQSNPGATAEIICEADLIRMIAKNPKSITMFNEDFTRTYGRIASRTVEILAEEAAKGGGEGETEQIQLVAEDPSVQIGFNLPDGPPPEDLRVEGEGAEEMDIEQVSDPLPLCAMAIV